MYILQLHQPVITILIYLPRFQNEKRKVVSVCRICLADASRIDTYLLDIIMGKFNLFERLVSAEPMETQKLYCNSGNIAAEFQLFDHFIGC